MLSTIIYSLVAGVATLVLIANAAPSFDGNPCDRLGGVQNLRRVDFDVVTWEPPQVSELCFVFYSIVHQDDGGTRQIIQAGTRYEFERISCATNSINVTAKSFDVTSEITRTIDFRYPIFDLIPAPIGIGVVPGYTTASTYWQVAPVSVHACEIMQFLVIVRSSAGPSFQNVRVNVTDNANRVFRVNLANLNPGRRYQLYGVAFSGALQSNMSAQFQFTTQRD